MKELDGLMAYLPLLVPVLILQLGLMVAALLDLAKRTATRGPKWVWVVVIVCINFIGPVVYFIVGREDE